MNADFSQIYTDNYHKIYNYVFYRFLNVAETEDVVGDIFFKALENYSQFAGRNEAGVGTWLYTIAKNSVNTYFRRKKRISFTPLENETLTAPDIITDWEDKEALIALLKTLNDREREILALRYWGGMSYAEIAARTGISEKNVSMILSRAVARLRRLKD